MFLTGYWNVDSWCKCVSSYFLASM